MYANLEVERVHSEHTEEFVAQKLGLTEKAYRLRIKYGAFSLSEARELALLYNQTVEYLFQSV